MAFRKLDGKRKENAVATDNGSPHSFHGGCLQFAALAQFVSRGARHVSCSDRVFFIFIRKAQGESASYLILLIETNCYITACNFRSHWPQRLRFPPPCLRAAVECWHVLDDWDSSVRRTGSQVPIKFCQGCLTFHAAIMPEMFPSVSSPAAHLFPINCSIFHMSFFSLFRLY